MQREQPSVAAVIVNYGAAALLTEHLDKLVQALSGYRDGHIYIVDNASPNAEYDALKAFVADKGLADRVSVIDAGANLGFAGGNNIAFAKARARGADFVFFINPDAYPREGTIDRLMTALTDDPGAAIAGARLENENGSPRYCQFDFPRLFGEFAKEAGIGFLSRQSAARKGASGETPFEVDWVSGAAFMLRAAAISDGPLMDDRYFLYFEETDMMLKLKRQGWKVLHAPAARVVHIGGYSTGVEHNTARPKRLPVYWFASWRHYFCKNYGRPYAAAAAMAKTAGVAAYAVHRFIRRKTNEKPDCYLEDVAGKCLVATLKGE